MKAVVFYDPSTASMEALVATFPRHKALADAYAARRDLLAIGTFAGTREGAMAVFRTRGRTGESRDGPCGTGPSRGDRQLACRDEGRQARRARRPRCRC